MKLDLHDIDVLRERGNLSYEEAVKYLEAAGGDVVQALVDLERDLKLEGEVMIEKGATLVGRIKDVIAAGNRTKIRISRDNETLAEIPVTAGLIGAIWAPSLTAVGALTALATKCSISIEKDEPAGAEEPAEYGLDNEYGPGPGLA